VNLGSAPRDAVGNVGGHWDHQHEVPWSGVGIKEGTGTTKWAVGHVDDYTGKEVEPTWPGVCTPPETDPVAWFVVAFIYRKD
jgi:hypothetical protein